MFQFSRQNTNTHGFKSQIKPICHDFSVLPVTLEAASGPGHLPGPVVPGLGHTEAEEAGHQGHGHQGGGGGHDAGSLVPHSCCVHTAARRGAGVHISPL